MLLKIATSALIAGASAGAIAAVLAWSFMQPLLLTAESLELASVPHAHAADTTADHSHQPAPQSAGSQLLRNAQSLVFFMLTYSGYALVIVAGMALAYERGFRLTVRQGLIWGVCGFVVFQIAPAFGLPPELPGTATAAIEARQVWWFGTTLATAIALAMIAFGRNWAVWGAAIILLAAPHIMGAPQPAELSGTVPAELAALFATRSLGVSLVAWAVLGALGAAAFLRQTRGP
jgi:cobalt transporter subunit CbtA